MLNDLHDNDDVMEQQMVLAATQVEQSITKSAIFKKSQPPITPQQTFQNCTFGNISTLNIHIHKH